MIKTFSQIIWHFIYARPDKILITIILPLLMLGTLDYRNNMQEYKKFIMDKWILLFPVKIEYSGFQFLLVASSDCCEKTTGANFII